MKRNTFQKTGRTSSRPHWLLILLVIALFLATVDFVILPSLPGFVRKPTRLKSDKAAIRIVQDVCLDYHIQSAWMKKNRDELTIKIPEKFLFHQFFLTLSKKLQEKDLDVLSCQENLINQTIQVEVGKKGKTSEKILFIRNANLPAVAGRIAIIVDDFGYGYNEMIRDFIFFPFPITLSILPGLPETERIARDAALAEKEILVHMPMEPLKEKVKDNGFLLFGGQDPQITVLRIRSALSLLPDAVGINNHQGSKATQNPELMKTVMTELAAQNKIFIDSFTTPHSVAYQIAKSMNLACAKNSLFIDAQDDPDFMNTQLERLASQAGESGYAIGIAHARKNTLKALQKKLPQLQTRGIKIVSVSKIANKIR